MIVALVLIVSGLVIGFGAFIFAAINMLRGVTSEDPSLWLLGHIGAIIAMAIGMLVFSIGVVLAIVNILNRVL